MNLSPLPIQKFFDNNGEPLVGGLLFTYVAGTTTKIATYTDSTGGSTNTNPVVLDYRGEARVWLDITKTYKFVLSPRGDTDPPTKAITTVDNIAAPISFADLTRSVIGLIFYPRSAQEIAASITPVNYYEYYANVYRYGVNTVPGTTDMSTPLASANTIALASSLPITIPGQLHIASSTTITAPITDSMSQLFSLTSAITISNAQPVRPEWWGSGQNTVHLAGLALPTTGGLIQLECKTYQRNNHVYDGGKYWAKANVTIRGRRFPQISSDCKSYTDGTGSIIQGTFLVFADNVSLENVAIDCGFTYTNTVNGGVATDALACTYPSTASKAANSLSRGLRLSNVGGLCNGPSDPNHAIIACEGYKDVTLTDDVVGIFGIHGVVFKAADVRAATVRAYCNGSEGVIIKSAAQTTAISQRVQIDKITTIANGPAGTTPYALPSSAPGAGTTGLRFHCEANSIYGVQIGEFLNDGYEYGLETIVAATFTCDTVQIGQIITRNNGTTGVNLNATAATSSLKRWQIGRVHARDTIVGVIANWIAGSSVKIGALHGETNTTATLAATSASNPIIDVLISDNCAAAYQITSTAKPLVGKTILTGTTTTYYQTSGSGQSPVLTGTWAQVGGGDTVNVLPWGYGIAINGLVSGGATNVIYTLPQFAWPPTEKRLLLQGRSGGTQAAIPVVVSTAGVVTINDATGLIANVSSYLSLAGLNYSLTN
jgi:hypothetical protein